MYFAFLWMDRWLKMMEALTEEQTKVVQSGGADTSLVDEQLNNLRSALADREHALSAALRRAKELEATLVSERERAEQRLADHQRELSERIKAADEAEEQQKRQSQEVARWDAELARLRDELTNVGVELQRRNTELEASKAESQRLQAQLKDAKAESQRSNAELERAKAESQRVDGESQRLNAELEVTRAEWQRLQAELEAARDELQGLKADLEGAKAEGHRLQDALQETQAATKAAQTHNERLKAEIADAGDQVETIRKHYEARCAELSEELAQVREGWRKAQREQADARQELDRLRADLAQARAAFTNAEETRRRLEREASEHRAKVDRERNEAEARLAERNRRLASAEKRTEGDQQEAIRPEEPAKKGRGTRKARGEAAEFSVDRAVVGTAPEPSTQAESLAESLVVHFARPAGWQGSVYVYYWDTEPATEKPEWPGVRLTDEGDGWLAHRFEGIRAANMIFNDSQGRQTGNLFRDHPGWFGSDGNWHDEKPAAEVSLTLP